MTLRGLVWSGLLASALSGAIGCAGADAEVGGSTASLAGGTVDGIPARFPAVVHVSFTVEDPTPERPRATCTGALVSPSHVVTAAHCAALTSRAWEGARGFDRPGAARIQGPIRVTITPSGGHEDRPRIVRNVRACAVHPDYAGAGSTSCREAFEFARANADDCQLQLQHDVAVLTLDAPVPVSWATGLPADPLDPLGQVTADFHRLLATTESPAIGEAVTEVGFGYTDARLLVGLGTRRYRDAVITGFDLSGADVIRLSGGPDVGILAGDSGGPVVWVDAPAPSPGEYAWASPPIGVHSCSVGFDPSRLHHTSLIAASNLAFVRAQLDRNLDGRFDAVCDPPIRSGDGVCQYLETCAAQPEDCGVCAPSCGNAACEPTLGETCASCRFDCGFCEPVFRTGVGFAPSATPGNDRDGDGVFDVDDVAPDHFDPCQEDRDRDGVGDAADNCPDRHNPGQASSDGDSFGDRCDNCPFVDNEDQRDVDIEIPDDDFPLRIGDGVGDGCDVCPARVDSLQADCNADATSAVRAREAARGVPEAERTPFRGDACDPTPCGETRIAATTSWPPTTTPIRTTRTDRVRVDGLASPPLLEPAQTAFRFCGCPEADGDDPVARDDCARLRACTIADTDNFAESERLGLEVLPWAYVTFELTDETPLPPPRGPGGGPPLVENPILAATYGRPTGAFVPDRSVRWPDPGQGVLWTHTPRFSTGRAFADPATRELASHYLSGGFHESSTVREPDPCIVLVTPFLGGGIGCPFCDGHFPAPWIASPGLDGRCFRAGFDVPILYLGTAGVTPGDGLPLEELGLFANEPGPWIAAAESAPWLPAEGVRHAKLDDANQLVRILAIHGDRLVDADQNPPPCPGPQCLTAHAAAASGELGPGPRAGAVTVLSARLDTLWLLGGRDAGGSATREAWAFDVSMRRWRRLDTQPSLGLGDVLAATYSPAEDALWILDRVERVVRRRTIRSARLIRLHPDGHAHQVVGEWPWHGHNDSFALASDPAGALWIAGGPSRSSGVVVALRFERFDGRRLQLDGWALDRGRLLPGAARAGDEGLTVAVERYTPTLVPIPVTGLRRAPGAERACF